MPSWKKYKLGEVITLNYGKSLTERNRIPGEIPVFGSSGITGWHNHPLIKNKGIIVGRKGTVGSIYKTNSPYYCIDTAYYIEPNDSIYNFKYLYYLLKTLNLDKLNFDSAVPGLNRDMAYNQDINLPPLPTQHRIAEILGALDDKIELNLQMNKTLEEMAMTLYKHWFVDFGPFKDGEFVDSELGPIPKGWEVKNLSEVTSKITDGSHHSPKTTETGIPMASVKDMHDWGINT
ncbi:MAG: restriction endonuclease subunit S, partial [Bacteroidales bacterium]